MTKSKPISLPNSTPEADDGPGPASSSSTTNSWKSFFSSKPKLRSRRNAKPEATSMNDNHHSETLKVSRKSQQSSVESKRNSKEPDPDDVAVVLNHDSAATTVAMEVSSSEGGDSSSADNHLPAIMDHHNMSLIGLSMVDEESQLDQAHKLVQQGIADFQESQTIHLDPFLKALYTLETYLGPSHALVAQLYHWIGYSIFQDYLQGREKVDRGGDEEELLPKALAALQKSLRIGLTVVGSTSSKPGTTSQINSIQYGSYSIQETQATISDILLEQGQPQIKVDHMLHSFKESIILEREGDASLARKDYSRALSAYELSLHVYYDQWHFRILEKIGFCHFSIHRRTGQSGARSNKHLDEALLWTRRSLKAMVESDDEVIIGSFCRQHNERIRVFKVIAEITKTYRTSNGKRNFSDAKIEKYLKKLRKSIALEKEATALLEVAQPSFLGTSFNFGQILSFTIPPGVASRALEKLQQSLDMEVDVLGQNHPVVAELLQQIAVVRSMVNDTQFLSPTSLISTQAFQRLEHELKAWKMCAKSWELQFRSLKAAAEDFENKSKTQKKELKQYKRKSISQTKELDSVQKAFKLLQVESGQQNERVKELEVLEHNYHSDETKATKTEVNRLSQELSEINASRDELAVSLKNLKAKYANMKLDAMDNRAKVEELNSRLSEAAVREASKDNEISQLKTKFESLWNESASHFQKLSAELSEKDAQITNLSSEIKQLTNEETLGRRLKALESEVRDLKGRRMILLDRNSALKAELSKLNSHRTRTIDKANEEISGWLHTLNARNDIYTQVLEKVSSNEQVSKDCGYLLSSGDNGISFEKEIDKRVFEVEQKINLAMQGADCKIETLTDSIGTFRQEIDKSLLILHHAAKKNRETLSARNISCHSFSTPIESKMMAGGQTGQDDETKEEPT